MARRLHPISLGRERSELRRGKASETIGGVMRDVSIELKPHIGELARVAAVLAQHQVALRAGTAVVAGGRIVARFVPSNIDATRRALDAAGIRFEEAEIVRVLLESRAGELAMLSSRLADAGVGVRAIYVTGTTASLLELAVVPENAAHAKRVLEADG